MTTPNQKQYISVKALIQKDGGFLFLKDPKGIWELPGGRIDFGESPEETLRRELHEELGYEQVEVGKIIDAWSFCVSKDGTEYQFVVLVFQCSVKDNEMKLSDEHVDFAWISRDQNAQFQMKDGYRCLFQ